MEGTAHDHRLEWRDVEVDGQRAVYGVTGGAGRPVLFLHGWGLNHRSYRHALGGLARRGVRVYAPAMPGFGTPDLPADQFSLGGYAAWVGRFLTAVDVTEPVVLIGHSFGGGVAIQFAHDAVGRVSQLVLVNSIGGSVWTDRNGRERHMRDRPLWDWGLHLQTDTFSLRQLTRIAPVIAADALPNVLRRPRSLWQVGRLARDADLGAELKELRRRRLPVTILWGRHDTVLPQAGLESMRAVLGTEAVRTVDGSHSWLLVSPARFAEELTNILDGG